MVSFSSRIGAPLKPLELTFLRDITIEFGLKDTIMSKELIQKIEHFQGEATASVGAAADLQALQDLKVKFLGKKGQLTEILKALGGLSPEERKEVGAKANDVKGAIAAAFESKENELKRKQIEEKLKSENLDVTLGGEPFPTGGRHPISLVMEQVREIFLRLGFDICDGPEIETDYYNFESLNIPADHPARDMQDTFYLPDGHVLRTHTSPVQSHILESEEPPIAMVAPGVVYRCDSDVTHSPMFHQLEALVVDTDITFRHLRAVIHELLTQVFNRDLNLRFRSSFFPFTEPSAEVDMSCLFCDQKGCRICSHTGWLEIMGCGMVDPAVFEYANIDPEKYSGFAFGLGIERVAMLKYGINDIRLFFENDIRFLKQFSGV